MKKNDFVLGIDEAGRGPLAGRVFVGAVLLPQKHDALFRDAPAPLRDSKKLTEKQRKAWMGWIKNKNIPWVVRAVSARVIDQINISRATQRAAQRAYDVIARDVLHLHIIADGSIRITTIGLHTLVNEPKADERYPVVSLASIVAKVHRDQEMIRLHKKLPQYGFDKHKGYGTKAHMDAIKIYGPSHIHRRSFLKD